MHVFYKRLFSWFRLGKMKIQYYFNPPEKIIPRLWKELLRNIVKHLLIENGKLKSRNLAWISSKLYCRAMHHLRCIWLLQRRCKRGTVEQENLSIFGKQWFEQSISKRCFETVCGKPNVNWFLHRVTCLLRMLFALSNWTSCGAEWTLVHFVVLKIISDGTWLNVGWIVVVYQIFTPLNILWRTN